MAFPGKGCFVAWFDVPAGRERDHDEWHTHEHMIERVAIPGFQRGLRYRSLTHNPRLCVIYLAESVETFISPAYIQRLNNPTPWTSKIMPLFRSMSRTLCSVAITHGHGIGGYLATIQLSPGPEGPERLKIWLAAELARLSRQSGLCGAHLVQGDRAASQTKTQEVILRGQPDAVADWIVLIEGYDRESVEHTLHRLSSLPGLASHGARADLVTGLYSLDFVIDEREAKLLWRKPSSDSE